MPLKRASDLFWEGRMPRQAPEIDGVALMNDFEGGEPCSGWLRRLRITEAHDYELVGTLLPASDADADLAPPGLIGAYPDHPSFRRHLR